MLIDYAAGRRRKKRMANPEVMNLMELCRGETMRFCEAHVPAWGGEVERHAANVARRVLHNLGTGRVQKRYKVARESWPVRPVMAQYIELVLHYYHTTSALLGGLERGDDWAWDELYVRLRNAAGRALARAEGLDGRRTDAADDYASMACLLVHGNTYPCDVAFYAWAHVILANCMRRAGRSRDLVLRTPQRVSSLDDAFRVRGWHSRHETLEDGRWLAGLEQAENRDELLRMMARALTARERSVIAATFFYELADAEIARVHGTTAAYVQVIRHRALRRLRRAYAELGEALHGAELGSAAA